MRPGEASRYADLMPRRHHHRLHHGWIYHVAHGVPYHREDSFRGIIFAAQHGYVWIDLDLQITKDGVVVVCHWPRPLLHDGFIDPEHKISRWAKVSDLTWAEVQRLHTKDGYHIRTLDQCLAVCASHGIGAKVEPKGDRRFNAQPIWNQIKAEADRHHARISAYALIHNSFCLKYVRAAGIPASRLSH